MPTLIERIKNRKPGDPLPDLSKANLQGANLYGADLSGTHLSGASLSGANLSSANLHGANLSGAVLSGAVLYGAKFDEKTVLDTGETWAAYLREVAPVLQTILALGDGTISELLKPRYRQFLVFKEAGLIPTGG